MKLTLYYAPSTCALVPWVTLTEAKAEFETINLNFRKNQHMSPDYIALNPRHKVPLLAIDDWLLSENVAIQTWIARQFPQAHLLPTSSHDEIKAISLMSWIASGIHPFLSRINSPARVADDAHHSVIQLATKVLDENFSIANSMLTNRDFFFDHFTAVDAHFYWAFRRATQLHIPLSQFSACGAHFERIQQRDSVQKVLAYEKRTLEDFARA